MIEYEVYHDEFKGDSSCNEYWHGILSYLKKTREFHTIDLNQDIKSIRDFIMLYLFT